MTQWQPWLAGALLCAVTLAVFSPAFRAEFVPWDDDLNIFQNQHIRGLTPQNLEWMFTDTAYARRYMPLGWLGWAIQHEFSGLNPQPYHIINVILHCANAVLVFLLIHRLLCLSRRAPNDSVSGVNFWWASFLGALIWSIHPLRVEAVAWASSRLYDQAFFFALMSLLLYLRYAAASVEKRSPGTLALAVLCFAASLLTYPITLSLVVVPLVLDFFPLRRFRREPNWWNAHNLKVLAEKLPFFIVCGAIFAITLWARANARDLFAPPPTLAEFTLPSRAMQAFYIWAYYLWKPFVPFHLAPTYNTLVAFDPLAPKFIAGLCAVLGVTALVIWQRRRCPALTAAWCCHLLLLVPLLGLTERPHYPSDRYSYGVAIVFSVLIAGGLLAAWPRGSRVLWTGLALLACAGCAALSFRQSQFWKTPETLFRYTIAEVGDTPISGPIHWRLGRVLAKEGRYEEAFAELSAAVRLNPHDSAAHATYATVLAERGRAREAVTHYREAVRLNPNWPEVLNNFAWLLATHPDAQVRNGAEAVRVAERACQLTANQRPTYLGTLAAAYAEAGRFPEAIATAETARTLAYARGQAEIAAKNAELLELYRAGKPMRELQ